MKVKVKRKDEGPQIVTIETEFIKLDAFLKFAGAASTGGEAKVAIQEGHVLVNGEVCLMRGKKLRPGDLVAYEGKSYLLDGGLACG